MIYLNLGRRELGKTTLAAYLASKRARRVLFDPRGLLATGERITTPDDVRDAFELMRRGKRSEIVITPDLELESCFDVACWQVKTLLRNGQSDIAFVIDELRFIPDPNKNADLDWMIRCAPRQSALIVFTAHRPADVPTDIRGISDYWCLFQMTQEHDLRVVTERCGEDVSKVVARLQPRQFVAWDDARGSFTTHVHPDRWFIALAPEQARVQAPAPLDELGGQPTPLSQAFDFTR